MNPILEVLFLARFSAKSAHLSQSSNAWLNEASHPVIIRNLAKQLVVVDEMRPRSHNAHFAFKHVDELRQFINAHLAQPASRGIHAWIGECRLARLFSVI